MKSLITIFTFITLLIANITWAEHSTKLNNNDLLVQKTSTQGKTINVKVNGLVCDFCARALEKIFSKRKEVNSIDVDLDNSLVKIYVKQDHDIDDQTLTKLITDSGYNVVSIDREGKNDIIKKD